MDKLFRYMSEDNLLFSDHWGCNA